MTERLREHGLTINGFFVLMNLLEAEGLTQSDLGKNLTLPAYGMTRLIDSLSDIGLVERREDPSSRRNHLIFLTKEGHAIGPQVFAIVAEVNQQLLNGLEPDEKQAFTAILAKLV